MNVLKKSHIIINIIIIIWEFFSRKEYLSEYYKGAHRGKADTTHYQGNMRFGVETLSRGREQSKNKEKKGEE